MFQKITIGTVAATLVGVFITSIFVNKDVSILSLFLTKITATSIITGIFCSIYAFFSKSKLQVFIISIGIGIAVFYIKYLITGHHFDPITMGAFVGAILGSIFAILKKIKQSVNVYTKLQTLKKRRL